MIIATIIPCRSFQVEQSSTVVNLFIPLISSGILPVAAHLLPTAAGINANVSINIMDILIDLVTSTQQDSVMLVWS